MKIERSLKITLDDGTVWAREQHGWKLNRLKGRVIWQAEWMESHKEYVFHHDITPTAQLINALVKEIG